MTRPARRLAALAVVPVLVLTVGCGKASEKIAEKALEHQTGADVDLDSNGGISIETEDGSYSADADGNVVIETDEGTITAGAGLPDGWPEDLPIPDGVAITYGSVSAEFASATGMSERSPADLMDDIRAAFAGWEVEDESTTTSTGSEMRHVMLVQGDRTVTVQVITDGEGGSTTFSMHQEVSADGA